MTSPPIPRRSRHILGWTGAAFATYLAVFVLPYRFPPREPVLSDTWIAGANNRVAAIALAVVSLVVLLTLAWSHRNDATSQLTPTPAQPDPDHPLSPRILLAAMLAAVLWTAALGSAVARAHMYWGDEGYFLNQLRTGLIFHQHLYTQFEFPYGPALYGWPALCIRALAPLHVSITAAYLIALALAQCAGLALLRYVINALPLRRSLRIAAFVLITFGTLTSLLGLNYSLLRFILPFAAVVLLSRQATLARAAVLAALAEITLLSVSPELGLAFAGATTVYAILRAFARNLSWLLLAPAALLGAAGFALVEGPAYLFTLHNMAKGGFNLLLSPAPHILVLLFTVVALAPLAVVRNLRHPLGPMLCAFYVAALGVLPAALGRCDPIHVFFNGLGFYLLAFVALNSAAASWRRLWITLVALIFVLTQAANFRLYQYRLGLVLRRTPVQEDQGFDLAALRRAIGSAPISAPLLPPQRVLDDLTRTHQYVPGYFCGWVGVWDRASEQRLVADMRRTPFALVAFTDPVSPDPAGDRRILRLMHFGLAHHPPRPPYIRGALLDSELKANWIPLKTFGDYVLWRQRPSPQTSAP